MAATLRKILFSQLKIEDQELRTVSELGNVVEILSRINKDAVGDILTIFPIVAIKKINDKREDKGDDEFTIIAGKRSYHVARAKILPDQKVPVMVVDAFEVDRFAPLDDIYSALIFHASLDTLERLAKPYTIL